MHLLAQELGSHNINVNAVCPGRIWTPIWEAIAVNNKEVNPQNKEMSNYEIFIEQINYLLDSFVGFVCERLTRLMSLGLLFSILYNKTLILS